MTASTYTCDTTAALVQTKPTGGALAAIKRIKVLGSTPKVLNIKPARAGERKSMANPSEYCDSECNICGRFDECPDRKYDMSNDEIFGEPVEEDACDEEK